MDEDNFELRIGIKSREFSRDIIYMFLDDLDMFLISGQAMGLPGDFYLTQGDDRKIVWSKDLWDQSVQFLRTFEHNDYDVPFVTEWLSFLCEFKDKYCLVGFNL